MEKSHFDSLAATWDTEETILRNKAFALAIKKHLDGKVSKAMDFGCGTGLLTAQLIDKASSFLGIDTAGGMLEQFNQRFKNLPQVRSLAINLEKESMPETTGTFDLIMTAMAFHHLKAPEKTLSVFKEHLSPSGKIFVIDLDEEDGTFHPDNQGMGVQHFGLSRNTMESWARELKFSSFQHEIIYEIHKNDRVYGVGLGVFS